MYTTSQLATLLLAISPVLGYNPTDSVRASATETTTIPTNVPLGTAYNGAQHIDPSHIPPTESGAATTTPAPSAAGVAHVVDAAADLQSVTIHVNNKMKNPVSILYVSGSGSPPLKGQPTPGVIPAAKATSVVMPQNFIGQGTLGVKGDDPRGTKFELSLSPDPAQGGKHVPFVDVSYVDGYSVPMTCSCLGKAVTGCNLQLFNLGKCGQEGPGPVCYNPNFSKTEDFHGPATPFFKPCQGAAYTFPADDGATRSCLGSKEITCCIGTDCPAPKRQSPAPSKRDVMKRLVREIAA